jgi:hypothetical protein
MPVDSSTLVAAQASLALESLAGVAVASTLPLESLAQLIASVSIYWESDGTIRVFALGTELTSRPLSGPMRSYEAIAHRITSEPADGRLQTRGQDDRLSTVNAGSRVLRSTRKP